MAATIYTLATGWASGARYTASGSTDVLLGNPGRLYPVRWTITANDTTPTTAPADAMPLAPNMTQAMTLADGERLWVSGTGKAVLEV